MILSKNISKKLPFAIIIGVLFLLFGIPAHAAERFDVSISPILIEYTPTPGETIKDKIKIRNNTDTETALSVTIQKMGAAGQDGTATFENIDATDDFPKWVTFENKNFTVPKEEWVTVPFTINVPKEAAFGYYYAFVIQPQTAAPESNTGRTEIVGGVAIPILMQIKSEGAVAAGQLLNFRTSKKLYEYSPIDFKALIQNTGNVHIKPRGNVFISKKKKKDIAVLEINADKGAILPDSSREFTTRWNDGFVTRQTVIEDGQTKLDENGNPVTKLSLNWDNVKKIRFGHYTAKVIMAYDDGTKDVVLEQETDFWVIPYTFIGIILLLIIGRFIILRKFRKKRQEKILKRQKEAWEQEQKNGGKEKVAKKKGKK